MKRTYADRPNWKRIEKKEFKLTYVENKDFKGYLSAIFIQKVKAPLIIETAGKKRILADENFIWMQIFPNNSNYAITTMFNEKEEVVQWYFDICDGNKVSPTGMPYYDDLYLDVVLLPSGETILLDEDELIEALDNRKITKEQFDLAYLEANNLIKDLQHNKNKLPLRSKAYLKLVMNKSGK